MLGLVYSWILSIGLLGCGFSVYAETPVANQPTHNLVAKVMWVKGTFHAMSLNASSRTLASGSLIYLHDTLITGDRSQAQIIFTDNTLMTFRPHSNFYVRDYRYEPTTKNDVGEYVS